MSTKAILGGTFDPFHNGHLSIVDAAMEELDIENVTLLPTYVQPFKWEKHAPNCRDRFNMLKKLTEKDERFLISDVEIKKKQVSYTFDTLTELLAGEMKGDRIVFLMGADSIMSVETWYKGIDLLQLCSFAVGIRPDIDETEVIDKIDHLREKYGAEIKPLRNRLIDVSSTEIKNRIRSNKDIGGMVPPQIEEYIVEHGLYK